VYEGEREREGGRERGREREIGKCQSALAKEKVFVDVCLRERDE
jgi:hypothetical protein